MRRVLGLLLIIIVFGSCIAYFVDPAFSATVKNLYTFSACDQPVTYQIGSIDKRFSITHSDLLTAVELAARKWNTAEGKTIFQYSPEKGEITVNLNYDERQALTSHIGELHSQLETEKSSIDPQIADFEKRVKDFKTRVAALNSRIEYWNRQGGAPEEEFNKLNTEQQSLREEQSVLDSMAQKLNRSTNEYNSQVGELNQTVDTFNDTLKTRPEEGLYNGGDNTITIYFMANRDELLHTLTHEFGHAAGLNHLEDPNAVMYYQTNGTLDLTAADLSALTYACRERTIIDLAEERFILLGQVVEKTFKRYKLIP